MSKSVEKSVDHPLRVAVFLDGSPGHEKQTKGIIKALEKIHPLDIKKIKIIKKTLLEDVWCWIIYILGLGFYKKNSRDDYDLLIGTGSHTHIPMLSLKRQSNALVCTCMAPPWLLRERFDICFIPQHDGLKEGGNIVLTVGPPNCSVADLDHDADKGLILLGGTDPKSHHWDSADIAASVQELATKEKETEWTISSSPRTPPETVSLIEKIALQFKNVTFYRYENTESGWVERQYGINKTVWVTADSMSMVYEALSAGCCVGILPVLWKNEENKFKRSEDFLLNRGFVVSFASWKKGNQRWKQNKPLAEADRCAHEIMKLWYQKN